MADWLQLRRLFALLCVAALLIAVVIPGGFGVLGTLVPIALPVASIAPAEQIGALAPELPFRPLLFAVAGRAPPV